MIPTIPSPPDLPFWPVALITIQQRLAWSQRQGLCLRCGQVLERPRLVTRQRGEHGPGQTSTISIKTCSAIALASFQPFPFALHCTVSPTEQDGMCYYPHLRAEQTESEGLKLYGRTAKEDRSPAPEPWSRALWSPELSPRGCSGISHVFVLPWPHH